MDSDTELLIKDLIHQRDKLAGLPSERIAVEALAKIAVGKGYYGAQAKEYKEIAIAALNNLAHEARKAGRHAEAAWIYGCLNV